MGNLGVAFVIGFIALVGIMYIGYLVNGHTLGGRGTRSQ